MPRHSRDNPSNSDSLTVNFLFWWFFFVIQNTVSGSYQWCTINQLLRISKITLEGDARLLLTLTFLSMINRTFSELWSSYSSNLVVLLFFSLGSKIKSLFFNVMLFVFHHFCFFQFIPCFVVWYYTCSISMLELIIQYLFSSERSPFIFWNLYI